MLWLTAEVITAKNHSVMDSHLLLDNHYFHCLSSVAGGNLPLWAKIFSMTVFNVCVTVCWNVCYVNMALLWPHPGFRILITSDITSENIILALQNWKWTSLIFSPGSFLFFVEIEELVPVIIIFLLFFRSCEKMNVVKENKDLACFYTTKHSWRGK